MEVHTHTHTARKKWTHYFWEFLMLFLAVFCGFLAENQREHIVEGHRAKEYAKGLLSDMRLDTGELRRGIAVTNLTISAIDSIVSNSRKSTNNNTVPAAVYYYSRFISYSYRMDWSRSTSFARASATTTHRSTRSSRDNSRWWSRDRGLPT